MRSIEKPTEKVSELLTDCVSNTRGKIKKNRFLSCEPHLTNDEEIYDDHLQNKKVHLIKKKDTIEGLATCEEMGNIYKQKMAKKEQPGREHYEKLKTSAKGNKCPYCTQRDVSTLDHYLPKAVYPQYAITPINLVPSCKDCNFNKGEDKVIRYSQSIIHPYYDKIDDEIWLQAQVIEEDEISFAYEVIKPEDWDYSMYKRVARHFSLLKLNTLFSSEAVNEFGSYKVMFINLYREGGEILVKKHLHGCIVSFEAEYLNTWKVAQYRALLNSNWFFNVWLKNKVMVV